MDYDKIDWRNIILDNEKRLKFHRNDRYWLISLIVYQCFAAYTFLSVVVGYADGTLSDVFLPREQMLLMATLSVLWGWPLHAYGHRRLRAQTWYRSTEILHQDGLLVTTGQFRDSLSLKTRYRLIPYSKVDKVKFITCTTPDIHWEIRLAVGDTIYGFDGEKQAEYDRAKKFLDSVASKVGIVPEIETFTKEQWFGEE